MMTALQAALSKHGSAVDVVLKETFQHWPIDDSMRLIALLAIEVATSERDRRQEEARKDAFAIAATTPAVTSKED